MRQRSLGWSSGRSVGRSPTRRALKAARLIGRWADLWREWSRYARGVPLLAVIALIAISPSLVTAQDLGMPISPIWGVPEVGALPDDARGRLVRRGRDLITATYAHIGPEVADPAKRYAGNNLACRNCHLEAGTKRFGLPLWGLVDRYPRYSSETGGEITLEQRVNACMERSMNGRAMPIDAPEMQAIVAYIQFLSTGVPPGEKLSGLGAGHMPELDRAADPERGRPIYARACAVCHAPDGSGVRRGLPSTALGYMVPPLWGPDSFNDGAGMNRLIAAANFIHFNMPNGTEYDYPRLSPEDAWDVAAFMVAQPRPHKAGLDRDFPDRLTKPVDTPYGPYGDGFSEQQHKFGPLGLSGPSCHGSEWKRAADRA
jgi:thiosulfate dehydrogenase